MDYRDTMIKVRDGGGTHCDSENGRRDEGGEAMKGSTRDGTR